MNSETERLVASLLLPALEVVSDQYHDDDRHLGSEQECWWMILSKAFAVCAPHFDRRWSDAGIHPLSAKAEVADVYIKATQHDIRPAPDTISLRCKVVHARHGNNVLVLANVPSLPPDTDVKMLRPFSPDTKFGHRFLVAATSRPAAEHIAIILRLGL
jgi:hypothetical protein